MALDYLVGKMEKERYRIKTLPEEMKKVKGGAVTDEYLMKKKMEEDVDGFQKQKIEVKDPKEMTKWVKNCKILWCRLGRNN